MAVHVGVANLRGTNYFGSVVNRTARIMATGHGGQLLLSDDARNESSDVEVADLGVHYLKDLSAPEHVWQVLIDGLESEFPPLRSLDRRQANLPMQLSGFVGRSREIDDVLELLESNRLVTLRGLGGIGKTRLSLQIAAEAVGQSVDMVRFVALSPLADSASLSFHVLKTLGLSQPAGQTPVDTIATSIGSSSTLMVLDNCEHLDGAVPTLAVELLAACPNLRVLATSRNALGVAGEQVYAIEALPTGTNDSPAEQIFIARAQAANASIDFSGDREAVVSRICRRLDGIPLAIELAAARVRSMPPEEIERHLDERFRLLRSTKGFDERHRVLYDTLEWSYQHLEPDLQVLLRRLSVFAGLFTAADVLDVVGDDDHDLLLISDQLDELVDHSLVIADVSGEVAEYRLLDTVREFGAAALGEQREPLRARHAQYYAALSRRLFEQMLSPLEGTAVQHRNRVHDDIRAAYMWSRAHGRVDLVADIVARAAIDVHDARPDRGRGVGERGRRATRSVRRWAIADRCCLYQTAACLEINEGRAERARDLVGRAEELSLELAPDELADGSRRWQLGVLLPRPARRRRRHSRTSCYSTQHDRALRGARHHDHQSLGHPRLPEPAGSCARVRPDRADDARRRRRTDVADPRRMAGRPLLRSRSSRTLGTSARAPGSLPAGSQRIPGGHGDAPTVGLESARATAQSQAMAGAIEAIGKLSMADPTRGDRLDDASGHPPTARWPLPRRTHHPRMGGAESRHAGAPRSARGDRAADARSARRAGRRGDRRSDGRDELGNTARRDRLHPRCARRRVGQNSGD